MKIDFEGARLYVRPGPTDLRKGVTGLLAIIENEMHLDALSNSVFFFCNKSHRLLKKIELLNCWVHARRGFADAVKATSTNGQGPYAFGYLKPLTHSFAGLNGIFNPASKHAAQAIKLFKDVFDNENRLRKLFDEGKISETEFLVRRVKEVKPHMDNLHSWLLEKKQKEMILDSSKTKVVMEQEHHVLFCPLLKLPSRMGLLLKIISDVFLKKPLMLKLKMTGKSFSPGLFEITPYKIRGEWI